jgi:hypothetical protein
MSNLSMEIFIDLSYPEKHLFIFRPFDKILVLKFKCKLQIFNNDEMLIEYSIAIGRKPIGARHFESEDKSS